MKGINLIFWTGLLSAGLLLGESCNRGTRTAVTVEDSVLQVISTYLDWEGENGFSGVVLVKIPGAPPLIRSYGFANSELEIPNGPDVVFNIGALTKQFTGAAILKLQMLGKLNVHDTLGVFFPDFPAGLRKISLHRLLTHSSGLPVEIGSSTEVLTREELINRLKQLPDREYADSSYHYSHTGYNLLGLVIEKITGTDYESFVQQYLFKPAGMKRTGYRFPDWSNSVLAHGYSYCNDWGRPMDSGWLDDGPSWNRRASGGFLSTVNDLMAWHLALLGDQILDEKSKKLYYYPEPSVSINPVSKSAYGWQVIKSSRNTDVIAHNGWNGRFYADFLRYLKEDVTIILVSNRFRDGNQNMPYQLARIVFKYPDPPKLMGRKTECFDSLPSNRLGEISGELFSLLSHGSEKDISTFISKYVASHLTNKYGPDSLLASFRKMQLETGTVRYKQVRVFDNRIMFLDVIKLLDNQEASFMIFFDENEDYRIRGISYKSPDERY